MANRIQLRRDTAANWTRVNPILEDGEPGLEIDTNQIKYGDGNTAWRSLAYATTPVEALTEWEYTDTESGYTSTANLSYDFNVNTDNSHLNVNGDGTWSLGSTNDRTKIYSPFAGCVSIQTGDGIYWTFTPNGTTSFPGNLYVSGNVNNVNRISANSYVYANGVSILDGIVGSGSNYGDSNVAAYLWHANLDLTTVNFTSSPISYSGPGIQWPGVFQSEYYGNTQVAAYLLSNPQAGTYSNSNVASYLPTYSGNIAGNITKNGYTWTFAEDGKTAFPNNTINSPGSLAIQTPTGSVPTGVANWSGGGGWNQGFYSDLATTGGTGSGLTVDVAAGGGGYINISAITIHTPGSGYTNGDVITINNENDLPGTFTVVIAENTWDFGTDGAVSFPTGLSIGGSESYPLIDAPGELNVRSYSSVIISAEGGDYDWTFGNDGTTTFPDRGAVTITGNLTVGNLIVNGNTTTINTESYTVVDNIIQMAADNPADTLDIGFVGHRTVNGTLQHTGLIRDASTGIWELFSNVTAQPGTTVDFTQALLDDLQLDKLYADTVHLTGTPPANDYGQPGDLAGDIHVDENYLYYCTNDYGVGPGPWTTTLTAEKTGDPFKIQIAKSSVYGTPEWELYGNGAVAWAVAFENGPTGYVDMAPVSSGNDWILDLSSTPSVFGIGTQVTITDPTPVNQPIWKTIPLNTFQAAVTGTYSNTNVSAYLSSENITSANIGGSQTYSNTRIGELEANVGSFYTYANATFTGSGGTTYSNANVASYLPTYSGNVSAGNIVTTGATSGNISGANYISANAFQVSTGIFWANGTAWSSAGGGTIYSNTNVAAYLTTASITTTGNVTAGNLIGTQYGNTIGTTAIYTGNVTAANIIASQYGNSIGTTATYSGNITAANIITTGTYGNITGANVISANTVSVTTYVRTQPVTFASLPSAAAAGAGARAFITDGNTATFGSQVSGSGANAVPVYSNGTNWYVG